MLFCLLKIHSECVFGILFELPYINTDSCMKFALFRECAWMISIDMNTDRNSYLVRDEVLTNGQCHLDGIWLMSDWNSVHLELIFAVYVVGLGDGVFEHLFVSLLAQDSPDVHSLRFASASRTGARNEESEENQTHFAPVEPSALWRMRVRGLDDLLSPDLPLLHWNAITPIYSAEECAWFIDFFGNPNQRA